MTIPLNELSAIYNQNIAEGCDCEDKKDKKEKKAEMFPQGRTPMGGDGARPGKNRKAYVEPMSIEEVEPVKEGHCDVKDVECSPVEKKKDSKKMKEGVLDAALAGDKKMGELHKKVDKDVERMKAGKKFKEDLHVSWRDELREVSYGYNVADRNDAVTMKPQNSDDSRKEVTEKKIKNKIKINPPQGVTEGFKEIGGVVVEMYEITEKFVPPYEPLKTTSDEDAKKKKREMMQKTRDHDDKNSGKIAESDMTGAPSIKDAKPSKKTSVKYDSHMKVMAPSIKSEGLSVSDQMKVSQEYFKKRASRSSEEKKNEKEKHAKARSRISAMHKKPDPYKARAGESD